jgi:RNA polymerase sigma factor (sigma-70 family)
MVVSPRPEMGGLDSLFHAGRGSFIERYIPRSDGASRPVFPTTKLTALDGIRSPDDPVRRRSWDVIAAAYWKPAYKHVRLKWRLEPDDAADVVQSFFARAVEKEFFTDFDPTRARFRTFFRTCLDRHTANEAKAAARVKRGGGAQIVSLDFGAAEAELAMAHHETPDDVFDREWRRNLFASAVAALRAECEQTGKIAWFAVFERYDLCDDDERPTYAALGAALGLPTTTVTNHLAFARRELRKHVIQALEQITASRTELRDEAKALLGIDLA